MCADGVRSPLLERCFAWLDANWPEHEGPTVLSWGDARIGNMMFGADFRLTGAADWEKLRSEYAKRFGQRRCRRTLLN